MESGIIALPSLSRGPRGGGMTDAYAVVTLVTDWACGPLGLG